MANYSLLAVGTLSLLFGVAKATPNDVKNLVFYTPSSSNGGAWPGHVCTNRMSKNDIVADTDLLEEFTVGGDSEYGNFELSAPINIPSYSLGDGLIVAAANCGVSGRDCSFNFPTYLEAYFYNGTRAWRFPGNKGAGFASPITSNTRTTPEIVVGSSSGLVYTISARTGLPLDIFSVEGAVTTPSAFENANLYVVSLLGSDDSNFRGQETRLHVKVHTNAVASVASICKFASPVGTYMSANVKTGIALGPINGAGSRRIVYAPCQTGVLEAYEVTTLVGSESAVMMWNVTISPDSNDYMVGPPLVDPAGEYLIQAFNGRDFKDYGVTKLDAKTGELIWETTWTPAEGGSIITDIGMDIEDGTIYGLGHGNVTNSVYVFKIDNDGNNVTRMIYSNTDTGKPRLELPSGLLIDRAGNLLLSTNNIGLIVNKTTLELKQQFWGTSSYSRVQGSMVIDVEGSVWQLLSGAKNRIRKWSIVGPSTESPTASPTRPPTTAEGPTEAPTDAPNSGASFCIIFAASSLIGAMITAVELLY